MMCPWSLTRKPDPTLAWVSCPFNNVRTCSSCARASSYTRWAEAEIGGGISGGAGEGGWANAERPHTPSTASRHERARNDEFGLANVMAQF